MFDSLRKFDVYPKTHDDLKVRTLSGALISVCCILCASVLLVSEFRAWRTIETVDRLDVDTRTLPDAKLPVNIDVYFPSLPCGELVMEVTDDSGLEQLHVADTLQKLRVDRDGVPIDVPQRVDWSHQVAPAFQQRKVVSLMEDAYTHLRETLAHLDHEEEESPGLSESEHASHKAVLAQHAAAIHGRLGRLTEAASEGDASATDEHAASHLVLGARELAAFKAKVEASQAYTDAERGHVLSNLHAMSKSVDRLRNGSSASTAANLKEALRIRLSILSDNVQGFISAQDIDRRDRYASIEELLRDMMGEAALLPDAVGAHVNASVVALGDGLRRLSSGLRGGHRKDAELAFERQLTALFAELRGDETEPEHYCGSCYGASSDADRCCNTCDDIRDAYKTRRWGFPDPSTFEQCRKEARRSLSKLHEGEGCNIYGTMEVARQQCTFSIAPQSRLPSAKLQRAKGVPIEMLDVFNITHQIKRLSFGTDFPGLRSPLDGSWVHSPSGAAVARYFLKVVPTTYEFLGGESVHTNQFSSTQYFKALTSENAKAMMPTVNFVFELTPIKVHKTEGRKGSLLTFLTRTAALIGGLFTVAGILDSVTYASAKQIEKIKLGRQD